MTKSQQQSNVLRISWEAFQQHCYSLGKVILRGASRLPQPLFGIPKNGLIVAYEIARRFPGKFDIFSKPSEGVAVVDDLVDSGETIYPFVSGGYSCYALYLKRPVPEWCSSVKVLKEFGPPSPWIHLPWEKKEYPRDAVLRLLEYIGVPSAPYCIDDITAKLVTYLRRLINSD